MSCKAWKPLANSAQHRCHEYGARLGERPALVDQANHKVSEEQVKHRRGEHEEQDLEEAVDQAGPESGRGGVPRHIGQGRRGHGDPEQADGEVDEPLRVAERRHGTRSYERGQRNVDQRRNLEDPLARDHRKGVPGDATDGFPAPREPRTQRPRQSAGRRYLDSHLQQAPYQGGPCQCVRETLAPGRLSQK